MKVLILAGMLAAFSGLFFNAAKKDAGTQEAYAPVIEAAKRYVRDSGAGVPEAYGFSYALGQENFGAPGYRIADLDGDGTDELLLGEGNVVYDLYTVSDGSGTGIISVKTGKLQMKARAGRQIRPGSIMPLTACGFPLRKPFFTMGTGTRNIHGFTRTARARSRKSPSQRRRQMPSGEAIRTKIPAFFLS